MPGRAVAPLPTLLPKQSTQPSQTTQTTQPPQPAQATVTAGTDTTATHASLGTSSHTQTTATSSTATNSTRKKVTSACQGCQKRRVKCSGGQPCSTCVRTNTECLYTRELDGRSIKRKYHEVQRDQELLNDLLTTIRSSSEEYVNQIIELIRSGASLDDVKACVVQQLHDIILAGREKSPDFTQLQNGLELLKTDSGDRSRTMPRPDLLEIQRLADQPVYKLPAKPWTTVTDDDDLVSNLISVWLTWDKGWYDWVDEDLFVRDMKAGSLDAEFCSPFLVNCLLAWGCPYSEYKEARTLNGKVSPLMLKFTEEAKRLLNEETGDTVCLTTVQGLLFLHASLAMSGQDLGYRYMLQAIGMVRDLLASPPSLKMSTRAQAVRDMSYALDRTAWGVYIITTYTLTALLKPQTLQAPRRLRPQQYRDGGSFRLWTPFPYQDDPIPYHRDELFESACDVAIIEAELSQVLFGVEDETPGHGLESRIRTLLSDMYRLKGRLPERLVPKLGSHPSLFTHHARIHTVMLRMLLSLREQVTDSMPETAQVVDQDCTSAALEIARACKLFVDTWGSSRVSVIMCQSVVMCLSVLVEQAHISIYSREITDVCVAFRGMSRRWPVVMGMFRMMQLHVRDKGIKLPTETDKLFEEFEGSAWKQRGLRKYISTYPLPDTFKSAVVTGDEINMGQYLADMERLELNEKEEEPEEEDSFDGYDN